MLFCFYAMLRAVDGIIDSRSYAFYTSSYFYAIIVKMLKTPIWAYVYIMYTYNTCWSHTNNIFYNYELIYIQYSTVFSETNMSFYFACYLVSLGVFNFLKFMLFSVA